MSAQFPIIPSSSRGVLTVINNTPCPLQCSNIASNESNDGQFLDLSDGSNGKPATTLQPGETGIYVTEYDDRIFVTWKYTFPDNEPSPNGTDKVFYKIGFTVPPVGTNSATGSEYTGQQAYNEKGVPGFFTFNLGSTIPNVSDWDSGTKNNGKSVNYPVQLGPTINVRTIFNTLGVTGGG